MDPRLVEVIRSCIKPISVASVGWYPTADGILPNRADTSEPAWVKRKILSTRKRISFPPDSSSPSRNDSATVSPESATVARAPGGSFIWPNTRVAWLLSSSSLSIRLRSQEPSSILFSKASPYLITPDSIISRSRSFPSLVRSPTPANTEVPSYFFTMLLISSMMITVFPTPAPPKSPIFPPFE